MNNKIIDAVYFKEMERHIMDTNLWNSDKFFVFNHEASTGKSLFVKQLLGEMTKTRETKVLYVQKFKKNDGLNDTVGRINHFAGCTVAASYCSSMSKKCKNSLKEVQVLCITHQMYYQICKGNNKELVKDREMLIIDECPEFSKEVVVSKSDIAELWIQFNRIGEGAGKDLAQKLLDILNDTSKNREDNVLFLDFRLAKYDNLKNLFSKIYNSDELSLKDKESLKKFEIMFSGCFFASKEKFFSWESDFKLCRLNNNIILDANGEFDLRYMLSNDFEVKVQPKILDYSESELIHCIVNTTKSGLSGKRDKFHDMVMDKIDLKYASKILFVTDIEGEDSLKRAIDRKWSFLKKELLDAQIELNTKVVVDHFGNLIGRNDYRDFDTVVIVKTPNYDYSSYILDYGFFTQSFQDGEHITPYANKNIESLRISMVAGEMYQAIKRINRNNTLKSKIYIFSDMQEAVDLIKKQFMKMNYKTISLDLSERKYSKKNRPTSKKNELEKILLRYKKLGYKEVSKKQIREELDVSSQNLTKLLNEIKHFTTREGIFIDSGKKIKFTEK